MTTTADTPTRRVCIATPLTTAWPAAVLADGKVLRKTELAALDDAQRAAATVLAVVVSDSDNMAQGVVAELNDAQRSALLQLNAATEYPEDSPMIRGILSAASRAIGLSPKPTTSEPDADADATTDAAAIEDAHAETIDVATTSNVTVDELPADDAPQIDDVEGDQPTKPLGPLDKLRAMRAERNSLRDLLDERTIQRDELQAKLDDAEQVGDAQTSAVEALTAERDKARAERDTAQHQRDAAIAERDAALIARDDATTSLAALREQLAAMTRRAEEAENFRTQVEAELAADVA